MDKQLVNFKDFKTAPNDERNGGNYGDYVKLRLFKDGEWYKAQYRFDRHPNKGGWRDCLYVPNYSLFDDDKLNVRNFYQKDGKYYVDLSYLGEYIVELVN